MIGHSYLSRGKAVSSSRRTAVGPPGQQRKFLREIPKSFFCGSARDSANDRGRDGAHRRPARRGRGFKSSRGLRPLPRWASYADFFYPAERFEHSNDYQSNQRRSRARVSACCSVGFSRGPPIHCRSSSGNADLFSSGPRRSAAAGSCGNRRVIRGGGGYVGRGELG